MAEVSLLQAVERKLRGAAAFAIDMAGGIDSGRDADRATFFRREAAEWATIALALRAMKEVE